LVSGTRPEIIKLAPVYHALRETAWARVQWLHVRPDITLRRPGSSLLDFSLACREQLEQVMAQPFRVTRKHKETL
jgi:UDP-N-acetylglucosamine 2-epimerase (non-hydrolysing)